MNAVTETHTVELTDYNGLDIVTEINAAIASDLVVTINGDTVNTRFGRKVSHWGTGSVSFEVDSKRGSVNTRTMWLKPGRTINWTSTPLAPRA
jgi:hypothetical protein